MYDFNKAKQNRAKKGNHAGAPPKGVYRPPADPEDPRLSALYNQSVKDAGTVRDNANYSTEYDVTRGANDLGFQVGHSATGDYTTDFSLDPNNPFSKMALLQRSYEQEKSGTQNSYAAGGQLHSGAYGRMVNENQFQNDNNQQQLRNALQDLLERGRRSRAGAADDYAASTSGAATQALQMALGG